jgi:Zn-dependent protease
MKWSYRIGTFFGIDVRVHLTFLLLWAWLGWGAYADTGSMVSAMLAMGFVAALFLFVTMHEYGHALTAARFGIRTRQITLYPIGGVAMLESMPRSPREQLLVALAGPAVNFVLAALIAGLMVALGVDPFSPELGSGSRGLLGALLWANLVMGTFNLLPALPMDGGRVLRALLELRMGPLRSTQVAGRVAGWLALVMGLFALYSDHMMLLAIAAMVWMMSRMEVAMAQRQAAARAMSQQFDHALWGSAPGGPVPPARSPSTTRGMRVVAEVVDTPDGPRIRYLR